VIGRGLRKAVVLAAGRGTRMRREDRDARLDAKQAAVADSGLKTMIPIHGRPFFDYVLSALAEAGVEDICVVIGPGPSRIRDHGESLAPERLRLCFAVQEEPLGTADAVLASERFAGGDDFLVMNSDNLYPAAAYRSLRNLDGPGLPVFERERLLARSNFPRERLLKYATLSIGADGYLESVVEKPDAGTLASLSAPVWLSMNLWRFSPRIFEACRRVPPSARGELELPQAVSWAIASLGERLQAVPCEEGVLDLSTRSDVASVSERLRGVEVRL
jgi:dTDP-glucose pyrophosphorylase